MTSFFPTLYKDELLYSAIARYHQRSGNTSLQNTAKDLFNDKKARFSIALPFSLEKLSSNIPFSGEDFPLELIEKHTLFQYYTAFLNKERKARVIKSMLCGSGKGINPQVGLVASSVISNVFMKYCFECATESLNENGEVYWNRLHQIPGILVCPHHKTLLLDSSARNVSIKNQDCFLAGDYIDIFGKNNTQQNNLKIMQKEHLLYRANKISNLAKNIISLEKEISVENLKEHYKEKLFERGYVSAMGIIKQKKLMMDFIEHFSTEYLNSIQCSINSRNSTNWLKEITNLNRAFPTIKHLLVIEFLNINIDELSKSILRKEPFGKGPWKCLNPAAEHYRKDIIREIDISYNNTHKKIIGKFYCTCGFVYGRSGPDVNEKDRVRIGRIYSYGEVWEKKVCELFLAGNNIKSISKSLAASPITIKKYLVKNGLIENKDKSHICLEENKKQRILELKRNKWIKISHKNTHLNKTELSKKYSTLFDWLKRHDKEWINSFIHKSYKKNINREKVDWGKRDIEIKEKAEKIVSTLMENNNQTKITITRIGKEMGKVNMLSRNINRLPLTKKYIEDILRKIKEFQ